MTVTPTTDRPLISVVMPVYNAARYAGPAVRSVLAAPQDVEVVLVEDGSTDGSLAVCRRLTARYERVRLLRHRDGVNRGAGASRNLGIRAARGRHVAFLDADDLYLPTRFIVDVPMLEHDPDLDGVYGAVGTKFDDEHVPLPDGDREVTTIDGGLAPEELFRALLLGTHGAFHTAGITVRREVFERTGLFDPALRQAQDSAMWLKMAAVCRLAPGSIDEPVALWRRHPSNRTRRGAAEWRGAGEAYRWSVLRWAHSHGLPPDQVVWMRRALALAMVGRREGRRLLPRARRIVRMAAACGFRHAPLLWELGLLAARKFMGRPRVGQPKPQARPAAQPGRVRLRPAADRPLVSVVIPVYNGERFVAEAVHSVLALPQDVEVVLVEDGSRDGSLAACRELASRHPHVRLLRHAGGRNRGAAASRNVGIRAARGRYVSFLDADDLYLPNRLDVAVSMLERDPGLDGVYGAVGTQFDEGYVPMPGGDREVTTLDGPVEPDELFATLLLGARGSFCTPGITVRRSAFDLSGLFDEGLVLTEDSAMWLRLSATGRLTAGSIGEPIALRRRHGANDTSIRHPRWAGAGCDYVWSVLKWARRRGLEPIKQRQLLKGMALVMVDRRDGARLPGGVDRVLRRMLRYGWACPAVLPALLWVFVKKLLGRPLSDYRSRTATARREGGD